MGINQQAYNYGTQTAADHAACRQQSCCTQQIGFTMGTINLFSLYCHSKTKGYSSTDIDRELVQANHRPTRQPTVHHVHFTHDSLHTGPFISADTYQFTNSTSATTG
jgi:hypothetical protein